MRQLIKIAKTSTKPFDFIDNSKDSIKAINENEKNFTAKSPKKSSKMSQQKMSETYFKDNIPNKYNLPLPTNLTIHPSPTIKPTIPSPRVRLHTKTQMLCKMHQHQNVTQSKEYKTYPLLNHTYDNQGKQQTLDSLRQSDKKEVWERALSNEWGRLAQGNDNGIIATDTIDFIKKHEVPKTRDITYASFVCDHRPLKTEP